MANLDFPQQKSGSNVPDIMQLLQQAIQGISGGQQRERSQLQSSGYRLPPPRPYTEWGKDPDGLLSSIMYPGVDPSSSMPQPGTADAHNILGSLGNFNRIFGTGANQKNLALGIRMYVAYERARLAEQHEQAAEALERLKTAAESYDFNERQESSAVTAALAEFEQKNGTGPLRPGQETRELGARISEIAGQFGDHALIQAWNHNGIQGITDLMQAKDQHNLSLKQLITQEEKRAAADKTQTLFPQDRDQRQTQQQPQRQSAADIQQPQIAAGPAQPDAAGLSAMAQVTPQQAAQAAQGDQYGQPTNSGTFSPGDAGIGPPHPATVPAPPALQNPAGDTQGYDPKILGSSRGLNNVHAAFNGHEFGGIGQDAQQLLDSGVTTMYNKMTRAINDPNLQGNAAFQAYGAVDPTIANLAWNVAYYNSPPPNAGWGNRLYDLSQVVQQMAKKIRPDYWPPNYNLIADYSKHNSDSYKQFINTRTAMAPVLDLWKAIADVQKRYPNATVPQNFVARAIANTLGNRQGDDQWRYVGQVIRIMSQEVSRATVGQLRVTPYEDILRNLNTAETPQQLRAAIDGEVHALDQRSESYNDIYREVKGDGSDAPGYSYDSHRIAQAIHFADHNNNWVDPNMIPVNRATGQHDVPLLFEGSLLPKPQDAVPGVAVRYEKGTNRPIYLSTDGHWYHVVQ